MRAADLVLEALKDPAVRREVAAATRSERRNELAPEDFHELVRDAVRYWQAGDRDFVVDAMVECGPLAAALLALRVGAEAYRAGYPGVAAQIRRELESRVLLGVGGRW